MRVEELKISELVEFDSEGGLVRFANQRALIFDRRWALPCSLAVTEGILVSFCSSAD